MLHLLVDGLVLKKSLDHRLLVRAVLFPFALGVGVRVGIGGWVVHVIGSVFLLVHRSKEVVGLVLALEPILPIDEEQMVFLGDEINLRWLENDGVFRLPTQVLGVH